MARYELIGKTLKHSFSKPIHESLKLYRYNLHELPSEEAVKRYINARRFAGCNVTIPYKQTVIPLLDKLDEHAKRIGAVNTIVNRSGFLTGYNTDYNGFAYTLQRKGISLKGKRVLLLGNGGTAKTVRAVAQDAKAAEIVTASRGSLADCISYSEAASRKNIEIIVNTSPVGMYPNNGEVIVNIGDFPELSAVVDVVYNPLKTRLLYEAEKRGISTANGLPMLVEQAVSAARLFSGHRLKNNETESILCDLTAKFSNLVLVGMPSSGKSKLGKAVSAKLKKKFVDIDYLVVRKAGKSIPEIFAQDGEKAFRRLESDILREVSRGNGQVISTGGGIVTQPENMYYLKQNAVVILLDRPLELLKIGGDRPLSQNMEKLKEMQGKRHPLYKAVADKTIVNDQSFGFAMYKVVEAYYEVLGN